MNDISNERERICKNMNKWKVKLSNIQDSCSHVNIIKEYKSNTGNYDPSNDNYWANLKCPDCGKFWREDQ